MRRKKWYGEGSLTIEAANIVSLVLLLTGAVLCCGIRLYVMQTDYYMQKGEQMRSARYLDYPSSVESDERLEELENPEKTGQENTVFWDMTEIIRIKEGIFVE